MLINQAKTEDVSEEMVATVENQYWVDLKEALDRLEKNSDFQKVIKEGYFKDKAVNGVSLLATDYVRQNGMRAEIMEALVGISLLEDYFATIQNLGTTAPEDDEDEE